MYVCSSTARGHLPRTSWESTPGRECATLLCKGRDCPINPRDLRESNTHSILTVQKHEHVQTIGTKTKIRVIVSLVTSLHISDPESEFQRFGFPESILLRPRNLRWRCRCLATYTPSSRWGSVSWLSSPYRVSTPSHTQPRPRLRSGRIEIYGSHGGRSGEPKDSYPGSVMARVRGPIRDEENGPDRPVSGFPYGCRKEARKNVGKKRRRKAWEREGPYRYRDQMVYPKQFSRSIPADNTFSPWRLDWL